MKMVFHSSTYI